MLCKILKYDFRAMWKQFSIIWLAALVIALINRFTLPFQQADSTVGEGSPLLAMITISVFVGVMCAMFVVALIFVLTRFYQGLLGNEGYLMHTLPVKTWQLVLSKLICAVAAIVIVLFQPGNSTGIDALGGSSETFFGKNKGRSMESKMKKWTIICLVVLAVLAIIFFVLQLNAVWGITG